MCYEFEILDRCTTWNCMTTDGVSYLVKKLLYITNQKLTSDDIRKTEVTNQL